MIPWNPAATAQDHLAAAREVGPWPREIAGLGRLRTVAFERCSEPDCPTWTWSCYGTRTPLCLAHAKARAAAVPAVIDGKELEW